MGICQRMHFEASSAVSWSLSGYKKILKLAKMQITGLHFETFCSRCKYITYQLLRFGHAQKTNFHPLFFCWAYTRLHFGGNFWVNFTRFNFCHCLRLHLHCAQYGLKELFLLQKLDDEVVQLDVAIGRIRTGMWISSGSYRRFEGELVNK